jgi:diguanylate cyclase (GGDEF)-like protein/PAS domain S-box-containing protein
MTGKGQVQVRHDSAAAQPGRVAEADTRASSRRDNPASDPRKANGRSNTAIIALAVERQASRRFLIGQEWIFMAPAMAALLAVASLLELALPPISVIALVVSAIASTSATRILVRFERVPGQSRAMRHAAALLAVGLPSLMFGFAMSLWATQGGLHWHTALGTAVLLSLAISIALNSRLASRVCAHVALWAGMALVDPTPAKMFVIVAGCGIAAFAAFLQNQRNQQYDARQRELERVQVRAERLLAEYEQTGLGWFWETDRRGALAYLSPPICRLLGRKPADLIGRPFTDLFILDESNREGERTLNFHLSARSSFQELAVRAATTGDEERWWSVSGRPVHDEFNNFMGFRGSGTDLTEKRRSQEDASRLAHYDSLTSLANRFQMSQTLEKILNSQRVEQRACAVFLLDLDRFKQVNDTMGHPAGDALLTQVAQRLERTVDTAGRVGRLGGDEFQVILPGAHRREDLAQLANRIIENLSHPYSIDGLSAVIGASVGIAISPDDGVTSEALIRNADLALYAAKDSGRGRYHFYAPDLHSDAEARRQLEHDMRDALANGGMEMHYQPVVETTTEKITGFEALLRWNHPRLGSLSPSKFIPIAEEAGLIAQIGEWALRTACQDLASWPKSVRVAVNVSPLQFANPALPAIVTSALAAAQLEPERLELEITESVFLNDDAGTDAMFTALKRIGVRLSLDDFGTGYSSLGYLKKAPFDKIKIDQSFVRGATMPGSRNGAIISSIISLAEALGMETTAEGVETLDELDLMRMLGCSHIQGFIYERPLSSSAAAARLETGLIAIAKGPRASRARRHSMLRKVVLDHQGERYQGTIRNISPRGAMIEGLWNVPVGTVFDIQISDQRTLQATTRWAQQDRIGVEFAEMLELDETGRFLPVAARPQRKPGEGILLRKAG